MKAVGRQCDARNLGGGQAQVNELEMRQLCRDEVRRVGHAELLYIIDNIVPSVSCMTTIVDTRVPESELLDIAVDGLGQVACDLIDGQLNRLLVRDGQEPENRRSERRDKQRKPARRDDQRRPAEETIEKKTPTSPRSPSNSPPRECWTDAEIKYGDISKCIPKRKIPILKKKTPAVAVAAPLPVVEKKPVELEIEEGEVVDEVVEMSEAEKKICDDLYGDL